jgi:endonuclease YncB( thermonuclease family)
MRSIISAVAFLVIAGAVLGATASARTNGTLVRQPDKITSLNAFLFFNDTSGFSQAIPENTPLWNTLHGEGRARHPSDATYVRVVVSGQTKDYARNRAVPVAASGVASALRIDHVADGDTVDLTNGARVRLVQIDTPEVYFTPECYGSQASAITKRLLPPGTLVRLTTEPATDRVDQYGRLLRSVSRARDGLNVNLYLVRVGAAAPYFYAGRRGIYAAQLDRFARRARSLHLGLWAACQRTQYRPTQGVSTGQP